MPRLEGILKKLMEIESALKANTNRLWAINLSLAAAFQGGQSAKDFVPRRLVDRRREEQVIFDRLLRHFYRLMSHEMDSSFVAFSSTDDIRVMIRIRQKIRYIQNAFANEPATGETLMRLNTILPDGVESQALPAFSKN